MWFLVLQAYWNLIRFELYLARGNFTALYNQVRNYPVRIGNTPIDADERIRCAMDTACIWYWKEVRCLQRSAAAACLLRRYAIPAQMFIGIQQMPFQAHAWVEVNGRVVNDQPYVSEIYTVLDRC